MNHVCIRFNSAEAADIFIQAAQHSDMFESLTVQDEQTILIFADDDVLDVFCKTLNGTDVHIIKENAKIN